MGTGRYSSKHTSKVSTNSQTQSSGPHNITIRSHTFSNNGISKEEVKNGVEHINTLLNYLGVKDSVLPQVTLLASKQLGYFTLGACNLAGDIKFNPRYFTGNESGKHLNTFSHEYTHALEALLIKSNLPDKFDQAVAWNNCMYAKGIIDSALKSMKKDPADWKKYAGLVSDYAKTDHSECLAEVCATFTSGKPSATSVHGKFVNSVMKHLKKELHNIK